MPMAWLGPVCVIAGVIAMDMASEKRRRKRSRE